MLVFDPKRDSGIFCLAGRVVRQETFYSFQEEVLKLEVIEKRFKEFGGLFAESSMRITEGRAQAPLKGDEVTGPLHKYLESLSSKFISQLPPQNLLLPWPRPPLALQLHRSVLASLR